MANIQPNRFVLQSGVVKVDYETPSFVGQPVLNLTEGSGPDPALFGVANPQARHGDRNIGNGDYPNDHRYRLDFV
jgi:hypothetical protein